MINKLLKLEERKYSHLIQTILSTSKDVSDKEINMIKDEEEEYENRVIEGSQSHLTRDSIQIPLLSDKLKIKMNKLFSQFPSKNQKEYDNDENEEEMIISPILSHLSTTTISLKRREKIKEEIKQFIPKSNLHLGQREK